MQSQNPLIADFVKLANSAAGTFAGMTREVRDSARERLKEAMGGLDFVTREEFDAVKDIAAKAREDCMRLEAKIAVLEAKLAPSSANSDATPHAMTDSVMAAGEE
jgi:BMFP domain-containing protein YqiC